MNWRNLSTFVAIYFLIMAAVSTSIVYLLGPFSPEVPNLFLHYFSSTLLHSIASFCVLFFIARTQKISRFYHLVIIILVGEVLGTILIFLLSSQLYISKLWFFEYPLALAIALLAYYAALRARGRPNAI